MLRGFPPFGEVFVSIENGEGQLGAVAARCACSLPTAPARSPRPAACPVASVFSEGHSQRLDSFGEVIVWLLTAPGRASWLQSQLAEARERGRASLGPLSGCLRPTPQSLDFFLSFSLSSLWWQIWGSFLASFFLFFFFFPLQR